MSNIILTDLGSKVHKDLETRSDAQLAGGLIMYSPSYILLDCVARWQVEGVPLSEDQLIHELILNGIEQTRVPEHLVLGHIKRV